MDPTQTDRFKAASTAASVTDLTDMFYLSDMSEPMPEIVDFRGNSATCISSIHR